MSDSIWLQKVAPWVWQLESVHYFLSSEAQLDGMVHVFNHLNQRKLADKVKALSRDEILYLALLLAPGNEPGLMLMLAFAQAIRILVKVQIKHKIRASAVRGCFF